MMPLALSVGSVILGCTIFLGCEELRVSATGDINAPAVLRVTEQVAARNVEPIGANLSTIAGGTNFAINNHAIGSGFEPAVWRKFVRVERSGDGWFEWDHEGGPGYWNLAWTGLGNGAKVRFYRIVDREGEALSYGSGNDLSNSEGADHVVFLGEGAIPMPSSQFPFGGYFANDDRDGSPENNAHRVYVAGANIKLRYGDYAYMVNETLGIDRDASPPDLRAHYRGDHPFFQPGPNWQGSLVKHMGSLPAGFGQPGKSCLMVEFSAAEPTFLSQVAFHPHEATGEGQWYSQLTPGATYRAEVWLRQEALGNGGKARFRFQGDPGYEAVSQSSGEAWEITANWQKYSYDFVAPEYPAISANHVSHGLEFTGPGKVWVDNFLLYRYDEAHEYRPFTPHRTSLDEFLRSVPAQGKKPALRFYGTLFHPSSVEALMGDYGNSAWSVAWNMGFDHPPAVTLAQSMIWALKTGDSPENRAVPHLTFNEEYTESDWKAIVEYLGVPYDPAEDSPTSKPYAYKRYVYRNQNGQPWTDEFREIILEYGNETWHNGAGGYGWHGWGRPGYVHSGGEEYGLFARYMFEEHVMRMPAWKKYKLGETIKFALGGNYDADYKSDTAYAERAALKAPSISYVGHANYVGPRWETGDKASASTVNSYGIQETLVSATTGIGSTIDDAAISRDALAKQGVAYDLIAYEGGPTGYWQNKDDPEVDEQYGKSAAMALASLDSWLHSSYRGFKHQSFWRLSGGKWWSSHTMPEAGGYRPHISWLALQLRNRYVSGDSMLEIEAISLPSYARDNALIPLVSAYAFQGENVLSLFLLNRKLAGEHSGFDFGNGTTPVTVELPFKEVKGVTLHKISRLDGQPTDPRDNNIDNMNVNIRSIELPASEFRSQFVVDQNTGAVLGGLPQGAIYLYVFELN